MAESLRRKLNDLSVLLADYLEWLQGHGLQDAECLLDLAAAALKKSPPAAPLASALWLDGFAEMTPPELDLLAAAAPRCEQLTLAFCLEGPPPVAPESWLSIWTGIGQTFSQCQARLGRAAGRAGDGGGFAAREVSRTGSPEIPSCGILRKNGRGRRILPEPAARSSRNHCGWRSA